MKYIIERNGHYFTGAWSKEIKCSDSNGMYYRKEYAPQWSKNRSDAMEYATFAWAEADCIGAIGITNPDYMDFIKDLA
ncbi:MAG: hypothetical protein M3P98_04200 [bacterium]|nr:hypothetical protein [bacterium]